MNQLEYEALFIEEQPTLPEHVRLFSQGNHQRSLIGQEWYYYGESVDEYALYTDVFVKETDTCVFVDMYEEGIKLNQHAIAIDKKHIHNLYPVQSLFPRPMTEKEAKSILRRHFLNQQERSTTNEIPSF